MKWLDFWAISLSWFTLGFVICNLLYLIML